MLYFPSFRGNADYVASANFLFCNPLHNLLLWWHYAHCQCLRKDVYHMHYLNHYCRAEVYSMNSNNCINFTRMWQRGHMLCTWINMVITLTKPQKHCSGHRPMHDIINEVHYDSAITKIIARISRYAPLALPILVWFPDPSVNIYACPPAHAQIYTFAEG